MTVEEAKRRRQEKALRAQVMGMQRRVNNFNSTYGNDYISSWKSHGDLDKYYKDVENQYRDVKSLYNLYNLYGTDEERAHLSSIEKSVKGYEDFLGGKNRAYATYGAFDNKNAYDSYVAQIIADNNRKNYLSTVNIADLERQYREKTSDMTNILGPMDDVKQLEQDIKDAKALQDLAALEKNRENLDYNQEEILNNVNSFSDEPTNGYYSYMTDEEKALYHYLVEQEQKNEGGNVFSNTWNALFKNAADGSTDAERYFKYLEPVLRQRQIDDVQDFARENQVLATGLSFLTNLGAMTTQPITLATGEYNQFADVTSALRGGASSTVDEIWQFLYNTGVSGVESALASAIPGPAGEIMLGASAAASAQNDILSRGGTSGQARIGGIAAGVTEAFFEHFSLGMLRQLKSKEIVSSLKIYLGNALKEVLTNASEEAATEIANVINDQIIMGELSNFNKLIEQNIANGMNENDAYLSAIKSIAKQVGEAAASGALMGLGFSAIGGASGLAQNYSLGSKAVKGDLSKIGSLNSEDALIARGNILFENAKGASKAENARIADANALIKKVTENKGKKTVGQKLRVGALMEAVNTESIKEGKTDIAKYLNVQKATETARSEAEKVEVKSGGDIKRSAVPKVVKIDGDKLSQIYVEQDGEAVSLEEMTFDNADIAEAYSLASNFGSVAVANSFMENYVANMDNVTPTEFWTAWAGIMTDGQTLRTDEKLMADVFGQYTDRISTEAKTAAWLAGVENKKGFSEKRRAEVAKIKEEWEKGGKRVKAGTYDDSALKGVKLDKQQKEFVAFARIFSDVFGMNVKLIATKKGARGDNGSYNRTTNTITLDIFAGIGNNDNYNAVQLAVANTLSHEVVHNMREVAYAQYEALQEYVFEVLRARGVDTDELVRYYMNHDKLSRNDAIEEVVAHSCDGMLATSATAREFMSGFYAKNKKAANKFTEFIRSVLKRLKAVFDSFAKRGAYDLESQVIAKAGKSAVEQLQKLYDAGILALREGNLAKNATLGMVSEGATITPDGTVMLQQRQYRETGRASVLEYLTEQYGADTANDMIDTMDKLYAVVDEIKDENPELDIFSQWQETEVELDEEGHPIFTSDIKNGDYVLNQDFSRVCKKRRQLDEVLNWLTSHKDFDVAYLTKDDYKKINDIIRKHGFEVACDLCFVDAKRFRQSEWAESFADTWNNLLDSITVSGTATPFNFATAGTDVSATDIVIDESRPISYNKFEDGKVKGKRSYANLSDFFSKDKNSIVKLMMRMIVENPEYRHHFRAADIISSKGFDEIQRRMPELRQVLNGWGGSSAPKSSSLDAVYDNSILNIKGYNKEAAYAVGGVRMNSFSDFIAHMFFDYCQAFADLAAKELPMQAYSKELTFFLLYGRTGGKLNMSGIPAPRGGAHSTLKIEKQFAGLDVAPLAEYLGKPIKDLTTADCLKHLDMLEYLWAKESIDIKKATLLQSGIRFDKLSDEKIDKCYDLIRQKKFDEAHSVAGRENVDLEYTKNIGIVAVGVSEPHIRKLLRDHTIRMVIPYHSSGINPNIAKAMRIYSYMNYTNVQGTMIRFKGKKAKKMTKKDHKIDDFNFYDYFGKTIDGVFYDAKATANRYIEWCREMSTDEYTIIPKFNQFTNEENYYKLLEDFDCYNTITEAHEAQGAVDFFGDTLPADYKAIITKELKQEQKNRDDFRAELDGTEMREEILDVVRNRGFNVDADEMKQGRRERNFLTKADVEKSFEAIWKQIKGSGQFAHYANVNEFLRNETDYEAVDYLLGAFDFVNGETPLSKVDGLFNDGSKNWKEKWLLGDILEAYQNGTLDRIKFKPNQQAEVAPETTAKEQPKTWQQKARALYADILGYLSEESRKKAPTYEEILSSETRFGTREAVYDLLKLARQDYESKGNDQRTARKNWDTYGYISTLAWNLDSLVTHQSDRYQLSTDQYQDVMKQARKSSEDDGYDYYKPFAEQVEDFEKGEFPSRGSLLVGRTPKLLVDLGFNALPVTINQIHVDYAINGTKDNDHHIGKYALKKLPKALGNPIAVIQSQSIGHENRAVIILKIKHDNSNVICAVEIDGVGWVNKNMVDSNEIVSTYAKQFAIEQLHAAVLNTIKGKTELFYWNKKEALYLLNDGRLQLPAIFQISDGFVHSIHDNGSNVNTKLKNILESRQFIRWFGDWKNKNKPSSKIVDKNGIPMIVYHGTNADFSIFDIDKSSDTTKRYINGFYFTTEEKVAQKIANLVEKNRGGKANVLAVYLDVRKPLVLTAKEYQRIGFDDKWREEILNRLTNEKYDGVIIKPEEERISGVFADSYNYEADESVYTNADKYGITDKDYAWWLSRAVSNPDFTATQIAVFKPEQIKSATDNLGTYDRGEKDILKQSRSESDIAYLDAVRRGDMETAQRMVDRAAWDAGYRTQSMRDGSPTEVFHGTSAKFSIFSHKAKTVHGKYFGKGFYFTDSKKAAEFFSGKGTKYYNPETGEFDIEKEAYVMGVYLNLGKHITINAQHFKTMSELQRAVYKVFDQDVQYSGLVVYNIKDGTDDLSTVYVVKNANQIKSADPVTYDEEGNIVPLSERFDESRDDIMHQKRIETPSPSALLKAVIRSNERYKHYGKYTESLKKYQDLDIRIRAAQGRVSEIDKEINEIKKKPAKQQNAKRLSELYERKQRESRTITEYRNRQFAMESNELRNIVANETAIARQETQQKEREQFRAKEQARRVRANATNNRRKLMRIVHELDKLLNRGNKKKHVKRGLRSTVETSLRLAQLLTFEQIGNDEVILLDDITIENDTERKYINEYRDLLDERNRIDGEIEKLYNENGADVAEKIEALSKDRDDVQGRINYRAGKLQDLLEREKNRLGKVKVGAILQELEDEYNALKDAEESYIRDMYNDFLAGRISALKDGLKDVYVKKMTEAELQEIVDLYNAILKTVKGANKAFLAEKNMTIQAMADDTRIEALAKGEKDRDHVILSTIRGFFTKNLTPTWFFEFLDSKTMTMLAKNLAQAEGEWAKTVREAAEFKERMDEKYGVGEWDINKTFTFDSKTGKTFEVTLEQLMSIYAYSKQGVEAERHLDNGGIVHAKSILVSGKKPVKNKDGKKINIKMYKIREGAAYKLSPEIRGEMIEELKKNAPKVTEYIDEMVGYLSSDLAKIGNATAEKLYGMEIFNNPYYFPIKSSEFWIRSKQEAQKGTVELKNWGATKERVPNASNPIVLDNFSDVWARHCLEMASFATMTLALEDMNRVFNYSERAGDDYDASSVRGTISRVYGSDYAEYIANLINQLNGGARSDDNVPAVDLLMSLAKAGATAGSLSVIVQQPTAIARAFAYINPKYFLTKPLTLKTLSSEWEELKKYAPVAIIKEMGGYDTGVGKKTTSYINAKQYNTFKEKAKGLVTDSGYRNEAIYYLPSKADELTWTYLWQAVKNEIADTTDLKRGTEEFLKACGERFEDVVRHTQVYDSMFARSELMRMKGTFARMATAFAAEPTLTMNMVAYSFKSGNKKMFASAMTSMLLNAAVVSLVYAARDDDEDETYAEKYIEALTGEILEGINPITYIPIIRDIWSIFLGYDVERLDMSAVADIWKAFEGLFSSRKTPYEKWTDFVGQIALFLGIPVKNLLREGEAVYNMIRMMIELVEGNHTDAEGILEALKEGAENAVPMGEKIFK